MRNDRIAIMLILLIFALFTLGCASPGTNTNKSTANVDSGTPSGADYKAACKDIPISDLSKDPDHFKGQKVVYKGYTRYSYFTLITLPDGQYGERFDGVSIHVDDGTNSNAQNVYAYIWDASVTGLNKSSSKDWNGSITIYGEVNGTSSVPGGGYSFTRLPRIDAKYVERATT